MQKRNKEELPWVDIILTAQERSILNDESGDLAKLYIALSERRDFKTGIAGLRTRISDKCLKEVMTLTKRQGRITKKVATSHLQRWLNQLKSCGLIIDKGNYVFELPLAPKYESMQNKCYQSVTGSVTTSVTKKETYKQSIKQDVFDELKMEVLPKVLPEVLPDPNIPQKLPEDLLNDLNNEKNIIKKTIGREAILAGFEKFWAAYPRKVKKKASLKVWKRMRLEERSEILIADVLRRVGEEIEWQDGFIPHPTTYLNQERWNDDVRSERPKHLSAGKSKQQLDDEADAHIDEVLNRKYPEHF